MKNREKRILRTYITILKQCKGVERTKLQLFGIVNRQLEIPYTHTVSFNNIVNKMLEEGYLDEYFKHNNLKTGYYKTSREGLKFLQTVYGE